MRRIILTKETWHAIRALTIALGVYIIVGSGIHTPEKSPLQGISLIHHGAFLEISVPSDFPHTATTTGLIVVARHTKVASVLGKGSEHFVQGAVNSEADVLLHPGESAYISAGESPTGTSFRVNACTGYLSQFQTFIPPLNRPCPTPLYTGGEASCAHYVSSLSSCEIVYNDIAFPKLSKQCRAFVASEFTYNGCTRSTPVTFYEWRLFTPGISSFENEPVIDLYDQSRRIIGSFQQADR